MRVNLLSYRLMLTSRLAAGAKATSSVTGLALAEAGVAAHRQLPFQAGPLILPLPLQTY